MITMMMAIIMSMLILELEMHVMMELIMIWMEFLTTQIIVLT